MVKVDAQQDLRHTIGQCIHQRGRFQAQQQVTQQMLLIRVSQACVKVKVQCSAEAASQDASLLIIHSVTNALPHGRRMPLASRCASKG